MVLRMATRKVTITLEVAQLKEIQDLVSAGQSASVSGFVKHAVRVALNDVAGWGAMLEDALDKTGGPLTGEEIAWADRVLAGTTPVKRGNRKRAA